MKPQIHNLKQQTNPHLQQQMMHQGHYGNANWNQNWNQQAGPLGQNPMQPVAGNAASWGSYGGNMQGVQQWGYY